MVDKIYSRKRISIPKVKGFRFPEKNPKIKKGVKIGLILTVAMITAVFIIRALNPMFNTLCLEKAKGIATDILNTESSKILKDVTYEELVSITRDNGGAIRMLQLNTVKINMLASDIAYQIQQELYKTENSSISMPIRKHYRE